MLKIQKNFLKKKKMNYMKIVQIPNAVYAWIITKKEIILRNTYIIYFIFFLLMKLFLS